MLTVYYVQRQSYAFIAYLLTMPSMCVCCSCDYHFLSIFIMDNKYFRLVLSGEHVPGFELCCIYLIDLILFLCTSISLSVCLPLTVCACACVRVCVCVCACACACVCVCVCVRVCDQFHICCLRRLLGIPERTESPTRRYFAVPACQVLRTWSWRPSSDGLATWWE